VEAAVALPLVLPPTVLGFYLLVLMGPRTAAGRAYRGLRSSPGLLFRRAPGRLRHLQPALCRAAHDLGLPLGGSRDSGSGRASLRSPGRILARVLLPLVRPFLLTAAVLAFTHTVGEFGVVLMIGGGIPGVTRTLSISIYDQVQDFAYAQANHTALLLLSLSFLALLIIYGRRGRAGV
jgi:molybdate transport system permease protein